MRIIELLIKLMNIDGTGASPLMLGNSATWSKDSKSIAFHASASNAPKLISILPGAASIDSDIFILNVDDFLRSKSPAKNVTNSPATVDDDPDWSPDGKKIVYTSHAVTDDQSNPVTAEIYVMNANGKGKPKRPIGGVGKFQLFTINADGTGEKQFTFTPGFNAFPSWGMATMNLK